MICVSNKLHASTNSRRLLVGWPMCELLELRMGLRALVYVHHQISSRQVLHYFHNWNTAEKGRCLHGAG